MDVTDYLIDLESNPNFRIDDLGSGIAGLRDGSINAMFSGSWDANSVKDALGDNMGVAAYLIRTIGLWGRVIRYFNLGGRLKDPHPLWHAESKFNELKKQVEDLQGTFPERVKFSPDNLRTHAAQSLGNQFLFLHICYQLIILFYELIMIHLVKFTQPVVFLNHGMKMVVGTIFQEIINMMSIRIETSTSQPKDDDANILLSVCKQS